MLAFLLQATAGTDCEADNSDTRIGRYTYPDVVLTCGPQQYLDEVTDTLLNPSLVTSLTIEVLSPSTEAYDRGEKFRAYASLPSLREYVLISQHARLVEQFCLLQEAGIRDWRYRAYSGSESMALHCGIPLPMDSIYRGL